MNKLIVSLLFTMICLPSLAENQNVYKFKMQSEIVLKKSCMYKGKDRANEFKIYIDQKFSDKITNLKVDLFVCPVMGKKKFIRKSFTIPLPTSLFENLADVIKEKSMSIEVPPKVKDGIVQKVLADYVSVSLTKSTDQISEFSIRYKKDGASLLSLGLIKLTFAKPDSLVTNVSGFNIHSSIPLKSISVELLDKNITLDADLIKIADSREGAASEVSTKKTTADADDDDEKD
jgi:hypothetical protein